MSKKVAVILSGCGQFDGSETHETVTLLLALTQEGIQWEAFAPNIAQTKVVDHYRNQDTSETRNVLEESARLVRGHIKPITEANIDDYDGVILPGGFGAALNLCDYATKGDGFSFQSEVEAFLKKSVAHHKPMGFICIAPVMIPRLYPKKVKMTIGNDVTIAKQMQSLGAEHVDCPATACVTDKTFKVVSTPANMVAKDISEVYQGIHALVKSLKGMM